MLRKKDSSKIPIENIIARKVNWEAKDDLERKPLTPTQKRYIMSNYNRMTIGEMATNTKADPKKILDFCDEQNLSLRKVYEKRAVEKDKKKKGMFFQDKNWMP